MLMLPNLPLMDLILIPPRDGLGAINSLLEKKQLSTRRGQLRLRCAKGGCGGVRTQHHFS